MQSKSKIGANGARLCLRFGELFLEASRVVFCH